MSEIKKIVYEPNYEGLKVQEVAFGNLENFYGGIQEYSLDIITDEKDTEVKLRPVVIFVHGGAFKQPTDKRQSCISLIGRKITKEGYIVISPDYPLFDNAEDNKNAPFETIIPRVTTAIKKAYDFVFENAEKYGFDTKRIAIMGSSAGGIACYHTLATYKDLSLTCFAALWGAIPVPPIDVSYYPPLFSVHGTLDLSYVREAPITALYADAHISRTLISLGGSRHSPLDKMDEYVPQLVKFLKFHFEKTN